MLRTIHVIILFICCVSLSQCVVDKDALCGGEHVCVCVELFTTRVTAVDIVAHLFLSSRSALIRAYMPPYSYLPFPLDTLRHKACYPQYYNGVCIWISVISMYHV